MALTLATVETAIEGILASGQSVTVDGMSYSKASLPALMQMRVTLKAEAARASRPTFRRVNMHKAGYGDSNTEPEVTLTSCS